MPPTAQIAAIRRRHDRYAATSNATGFVTQGHADMDALLTIWDTHQSALRALVAQWRETGKLFRVRVISQRAARTTSGRMADAYFGMADELERLLESEP